MARNVTIIDGHPDTDQHRLCHALAAAYEEGARAGAHAVRRIDIATLEFSILRSQSEFEGKPVAPDIARAQDAIRWADHVVIIYPLWLGTMPALLKAFIEQTFRPNFGFDYGSGKWPKPGLKGRSAHVVITMGMPAFAYRWFFGAHSLKSLERNILRFCGFKPVRDTIFGMVEGGSNAKRAGWLDRMRGYGRMAK